MERGTEREKKSLSINNLRTAFHPRPGSPERGFFISQNLNCPGVEKTNTSATPIEGAWDIVWGKYNETLQPIKISSQFKHFSDGFFSHIAWDTSGKLS